MNIHSPSESTLDKLEFINLLQLEAEKEGFKLWHCGSWAITAMLGHFFKDLKDIDIVVAAEEDKNKLCKIVENNNFKFVEEHPWGPVEYTNGSYEIEFGSAEDKRNMFYDAILNENNFGYLNGIKLYIADPKQILQSRFDMIKSGHKKMDENQQFIISTIESFIEKNGIS